VVSPAVVFDAVSVNTVEVLAHIVAVVVTDELGEGITVIVAAEEFALAQTPF
jgi:hypothetical protein